MKIWQIGAVGSIAVILGCGGMGAYVPDEPGNTGNPSQCALISTATNNDVFVSTNDTQEEGFTVFNGVIQGSVQTRAPGDAIVNLTVSGLPAGMSVNLSDSQLTVPLNGSQSITLDYVTSGTQPGTYNVLVTTQEAGCTPVAETITVTVQNDQEL